MILCHKASWANTSCSEQDLAELQQESHSLEGGLVQGGMKGNFLLYHTMENNRLSYVCQQD